MLCSLLCAGAGCPRLLVSALSVELFAFVLRLTVPDPVMADWLASLLMELSLCDAAGVPTAVLVALESSVISPVSFRAQPAKQINVPAINANFFISNSLFGCAAKWFAAALAPC